MLFCVTVAERAGTAARPRGVRRLLLCVVAWLLRYEARVAAAFYPPPVGESRSKPARLPEPGCSLAGQGPGARAPAGEIQDQLCGTAAGSL